MWHTSEVSDNVSSLEVAKEQEKSLSSSLENSDANSDETWKLSLPKLESAE